MPNAADYTDPYLGIYSAVPAAGEGVCRICHSGPGQGYDVCYSCSTTMGQVSYPTESIIPISLYQLTDQWWHVLRYYKDGTATMQTHLSTILAATIARFTYQHWNCIIALLGGTPTVVTTVPSTRNPPRPGEHPLAAVVRRSALLAPLYRSALAPGAVRITHNSASDDGFTVTSQLTTGARALLIEDTFTSGARTQSAASALRRAGVVAVAVVTAGRVINPGWNANCARIWAMAKATQFDFARCVVCRTG